MMIKQENLLLKSLIKLQKINEAEFNQLFKTQFIEYMNDVFNSEKTKLEKLRNL